MIIIHTPMFYMYVCVVVVVSDVYRVKSKPKIHIK